MTTSMDMAKRAFWGLRGPVKSCRIGRVSYPCFTGDKGGHRSTTILEFRWDGVCERRCFRDHRGLEWTNVCEFDDLGHPMTTRAVGPDGWSETRVWEYDAAARIRRVLVRGADGRERVAESYGYDATGLKTQTRHLESEECGSGFWGIEGTDASLDARGAVAITTFFDAEDRATTALFRDRSDLIVNRVDLRYDDAGNLIEEEAMSEPLPPGLAKLAGLGNEPMRRLFRYDERGRRIEMTIPFGPLGARKLVTSYNEHGDESRAFSYEEDREYEIDEGGHSSTAPVRVNVRRSWTRLSYRYDLHGNWIDQFVEGRTDADEEFFVSNRTYRTITYLRP